MLRATPLALCLLLAFGTAARANHIPIWNYRWSASPSVVTSDDGTRGQVQLNTWGDDFENGSRTLLASVVTPVGPASGTATFTNQGYSLMLHLTDVLYNTSGNLTFTGEFSGTLGSTFGLTNTYTSPATQSVTLGGDKYVVTLNPFIPPQGGVAPYFLAQVTVISPPNLPDFPDIPEPASLVLAVLGLSSLGLRCWLRRRAPWGVGRA